MSAGDEIRIYATSERDRHVYKVVTCDRGTAEETLPAIRDALAIQWREYDLRHRTHGNPLSGQVIDADGHEVTPERIYETRGNTYTTAYRLVEA